MDPPGLTQEQTIYAGALEYNERQNMSKTTTTGRTDKGFEPLRAMTDDEVMAAALSDPDAQPLTPDDFKRMKRVARAKIIRHALGLTQEEFAGRFRIPLGTLRDWEQGAAAEPDAAAKAYLHASLRSLARRAG
jgi:putative transcriptional regulator